LTERPFSIPSEPLARRLPVNNPNSRFERFAVEYDEGEAPAEGVDLYDDHSKSILSENDSPDLGFRFSVNPYRGCLHGCSYCLSGDTAILMADGRTKPLGEIRVGDRIYGTERRGFYRYYATTEVLDHWSVIKPAYRVTLDDGTTLITSGDHRLLSRRGWKHVTGKEQGRHRRAHLTTNDVLLGPGVNAPPPRETIEYRMGYLSGMIRGDGTIGVYDYSGRRRGKDVLYQFRLALADSEALERAHAYLEIFAIGTYEFRFQASSDGYREMRAIRTSSRSSVESIRSIIEFPLVANDDWRRGFLAGIFDAEGSYSGGVLRICNKDRTIIAAIDESLRHFAWDTAVEWRPNGVASVRIRGGLREHLRFFHTVDPAITRKRSIEGRALKSLQSVRVVSVVPLGLAMRLFDITTGTGDFLANGIVSHNCYARPSHEYLGFGAGTDFERKIMVKRQAPELLREAFERKSWRGELVVFSGNTDCYQPLERKLELTRRCLEVCVEYKNPIHVITKGVLVERDLDLLARLTRDAQAGLTLSIPFMDETVARSMEPYAATPSRRFEAMRRAAEAGIDVSINVAPLIPGLNDRDVVPLLEAAKAAGAISAGTSMLRLPGPVAQVFAERLERDFPLAAAKVLTRVREMRGGKLNDPRFGARQTGEGRYAKTVLDLFEVTVRRLGLDHRPVTPQATTFTRPQRGQLRLFE
jgi:DNA repair photolyase